MDLKDILKPIESELSQVETRLHDAARAEFGPLALVIDSIIDSGGKRIRPAVTLLAGRLFPQPDENLLKMAVSVELLHMATLIHDDLLDNATKRRGSATINSKWDSKSTVLAGDYVWAKAAKIAAEVGNPQVLGIFADTIMVIVEGEIKQDYTDAKSRPQRDEYYTRIYAKTASLFEGAMRSAGVLGNASEKHMNALGLYGRNLGTAFQIIDDVLDFVGTQAEVGKPIGNDLRQGVVTLPAIMYYENHPNHPVMNSIAVKNGHNSHDLDAVIQEISTSPELAAARAEAQDIVRAAQRALETLPKGKYRQALHDLADYVIARKK
ncbi:MAG: heptaprenyl diphosphate synthase subunit II [Chloroflexota bacterium]|nr:MAG: heptaprenyl diphosphate synthase subunit II [Chloroflexota bacterium]